MAILQKLISKNNFHLLVPIIQLVVYVIFNYQRDVLLYSDFQNYHQNALRLLRNEGLSNYILYFQAPGYPLFLKYIYLVHHSIQYTIIPWYNAAISSLISFTILYFYKSANKKTLLILSVLLIFNPIFLPLAPLLCAEFIFAICWLLGFNCLYKVLNSNTKNWMYLVFGALFFGIGQTIRPVALYQLILFLILVLVVPKISLLKIKFNITLPIKKCILFFSIFLLVALPIYRFMGYGNKIQPLQNGYWNIYVGLNAPSKGAFVANDFKLFNDYAQQKKWDTDTLNKHIKQLASGRWYNYWKRNLILLPNKVFNLITPLGNSIWALHPAFSNTKSQYFLLYFFKITSLLVLFIYILNFWAIYQWYQQPLLTSQQSFFIVLLASSIGYTLLHSLLLEIQSRYYAHHTLLHFWMFPLTLETFFNRFKNRKIKSIDADFRNVS